MKIYIIGSKGIPAQSGGIERHVEEISTRLADTGHDVFVYARKHYTKYKKNHYKGVKLIYSPSVKTKNLDAITATLWSSIHVLFQDADIIHYHGIGPSSLCWIPKLFKRSAKVVTTFHSQDYYHQKWGPFAKWYLRLGERITSVVPDLVITVSKNLRKYVLKNYKRQAVYIPNGIYPPTKHTDESYLKKFNLTKGNYLLTVNRLIRHKGIHHLIKAFKKLDQPTLKLVIAGSAAYTDDYYQELITLAGDNNNIIFAGNVPHDKLSALYKHAKIYVHPSESEGLSIALIEALSFGAPTLASDIPENKEVIDQLGGVTFKNKNVKDLTDQLNTLLTNTRKRNSVSKKAEQRALDVYNWDRITRATDAVYELTLDTPPPTHMLKTLYKHTAR